jgi:hypothetical protein
MTQQELDGLLAAHFAGTLDAEGQKQLGDALLADEAARRRFVELADQEAALRTLMEARRQLPVASCQLPEAGGSSNRLASDSANSQLFRKPNAESPKPVVAPAPHRRSGWLLPAVAAAALIVVSGLFASGILPSGSVTIKEFDNTSGRVEEQKLSDGTRLAIAPGAKLRATGRDAARRVRQLIKLESGEVEVTAPKALPGEVACRVETPEGLWVETVGTTFKVTCTWENERGERNVDRTKLTGVAITAVLLVAVSEGEVRTGNAVAAEAKVSVGESAALRASAEKGEQAGAVIRVGMSQKEAERILRAHGVRETDLAMEPPKSPAGGYMILKSYEVSASRAIAVVADRKDGEAYVVELSVCDEMQAPQAQRDWRKVREIDVRPPAISWGQVVSDGLRLGVSPGELPFAAGQGSFKVTLWWENTGKEAVEAPVFKPYGDSNLTGLQLIGKKGSDPFSLDAARATSAMVRSQMPGRRTLKPGERFSEALEIPFSKSALYQPPALAAGESLTLHFQIDRGVKFDPPKAQPSVTSGDLTLTGAAKAEEKPSWGPVVNGLQGRIEAEKSTVARGDDIKLTFWLRTDEKQKESLYVWDNKYSNGYRNDAYLVQTPSGLEVILCQPVQNAWDKNSPHPVELKPGVPVKLEGWTGSLKSLKAMGLDTAKTRAGTYTLTGIYEEVAGDAGDQGFAQYKGIRTWGGKLTTPPIKVTVEAPKPEEKVSWGQAVDGLKAGLATKETQFETGKPIELLVHVKNIGWAPQVLKEADSADSSAWKCVFKRLDALGEYNPDNRLISPSRAKDVALGPGESKRLNQTYDRPWRWIWSQADSRIDDFLPAGTYSVTAKFAHGATTLTTGALEIEIVAPAEAAAAPTFSAKPQRPADKVATEVAGGALILTVTSPGGIGSAEVKPEKGAWPKKVTVRLVLKGLEGFSAECGAKKVSARLGAAGGKGEPLDSARGPEALEGLAAEKKGEFIEVELPEGFAAGKDAVLKISWVDFYR